MTKHLEMISKCGLYTTTKDELLKAMEEVHSVHIYHQPLSTYFQVEKAQIEHLANSYWTDDLLITYRRTYDQLWIL